REEILPDFAASFEGDKFAFKQLAPGRYTLMIEAGNMTSGVIHGVEIAAGQEMKLPDFRLAGHAKRSAPARMKTDISGTVLLPDGTPANRVRVMLWGDQGSCLYQTICGDKGTFRFMGEV